MFEQLFIINETAGWPKIYKHWARLKEVCVFLLYKVTFVQPFTTHYALAQALRVIQREQRYKVAAHRTARPAFYRP